jgi:hypothetical protein
VHTITLSYGGDANYSSAGATLLQTVQNASTQVLLTSSANPATYAQPLTLTAAITSNGSIPSGVVSFSDGASTLGTTTLNASGIASLTLTSLSPGMHEIVANYAGDGRASASVSVPLELTVKQLTAVALSTSANPAQTLSGITFSAIVTGSGAGVPTGAIAFSDGTTQLGTVALDPNGQAVLTVTGLPAGKHSVVGSYVGDLTDFTSASQPLAQIVQLRGTGTSVSGSQTDATNPQQVTLIAVVRPDGSVTPTGTVTFSSGNLTLGTAGVDSTGVATLTVLLESGPENVIASYGGDPAYAASSSGATPIAGGAAPQFTLQLSSPSVTVVSKQHVSIGLMLSSVKGFSDTLQFGCLGLPPEATCTFSNPQTKLAADGTATLQLTVDTGDPLGSGAQAARVRPDPTPRILVCFLPLGGLLALIFQGRRRRFPALLAVLCAVALGMGLTGCSGLQTQGTPAGTYSFKITASGQGSGATQSQVVTLTVTQ